jgi:glycerol uptake facilitator-like aquaporin
VTKTTELALATFILAVAVLVATVTTEEAPPRRLARLRIACAVCAVLLVAGGVPGLVTGLGLAAACFALLLSVHAIWLDRLRAVRERAWHDQFERPFAEYVRRAGTRS